MLKFKGLQIYECMTSHKTIQQIKKTRLNKLSSQPFIRVRLCNMFPNSALKTAEDFHVKTYSNTG
jgi:hypothetical protein